MNHGQANALMIGYYLGWQYTQLPDRIDSLAHEVGIKADNSTERARLLIAMICDLRDRTGLANSIRSAGIPDSTLLADLDDLVEFTLKLGFSRIKPAGNEHSKSNRPYPRIQCELPSRFQHSFRRPGLWPSVYPWRQRLPV